MFSWGEEYWRSFRLRTSPAVPAGDGVQLLDLRFHVKDLSAGRRALAFIKNSGDVFIVRTNESKDGGRERGKYKFVKCQEKSEAVSCGDDVVVLLSERGSVFSVDTAHTPYTACSPKALSNIQVTQVACGSQHTVALTKDGQVYTWGQDCRGQLGLGRRKSGSGSPQHLRCLSSMPLVGVSAGGEQSFALSVSGAVFSWGRNDCGQLGLGDTGDRHIPTPVHYLNMKGTVFISCGSEHTAFLTKDGVVFTCGSGRYGQLGHNSFRDELRPRLVAELWGAKAAKIACGRYHTLVLTDSKKIYSFGCNEQGQLGRGEESHPSVPLPVQLPPGNTNDHVAENIYAGDDSSFATCAHHEMPAQIQEAQGLAGVHSGSDNVKLHSIENKLDKWTSECDSKSWKKIKQEIHWTFSSASFMNQSFIDQSNDSHFQTSPCNSGLDLSLAESVFGKLVMKDVILAEVEAAAVQLLHSLDKGPVGIEGLRVFLVFSVLLRAIQKHKSSTSLRLAEEVAAAMQKLSPEHHRILEGWWTWLSSSTIRRHVKVWRTALSATLSSLPAPRSSVKNILLVLQTLYNAYKKKKKKNPEAAFRLEVNEAFLLEELKLWFSKMKANRRTRSLNSSQDDSPDVDDPSFLLCSFSYLLDLKSKKMVFDNYATWTQNDHMEPQRMQLMWPFGWIPVSNPDYFELHLRRASLLEDTFAQLSIAHPSVFKKLLVVYFDGDTKVTQVYKKDFFHHLFHNIVATKSGMFMFNDSKTLAWFPSKTTEEDKAHFYLLGLLCGLALYNNSIIHLAFPLALFKKLLGVEPTLEDMMEFTPCVGRNLQYILNYEDDDLENQYIDFVINWDETEVDLDPKNPEKPVTNQNRKEFVDAYVNHAFNKSVANVFREFERGFFQVCERPMLQLFQPEELQGVLVGGGVYDWAKLKENTVYDWDYTLTQSTIRMFWEVFDELTEDQKKDFLWFVTGIRKVPILGMNQIQMRIRSKQIFSSSHDQHFPESLTCHCILELPSYSTKEIMRDRLIEAMKPENGFLE